MQILFQDLKLESEQEALDGCAGVTEQVLLRWAQRCGWVKKPIVFGANQSLLNRSQGLGNGSLLSKSQLSLIFQSVKVGKRDWLSYERFEECVRKIAVERGSGFTYTEMVLAIIRDSDGVSLDNRALSVTPKCPVATPHPTLDKNISLGLGEDFSMAVTGNNPMQQLKLQVPAQPGTDCESLLVQQGAGRWSATPR